MPPFDVKESTDPLWYCLKTQPKHEKLAAHFLRTKAELEVFCPMLRFQKATVTGRKWFEEALFPGYIFGKFPYLSHYRLVSGAMGVSKIVGFGGVPSVIGEEVILGLREFARDNETIEIAPEVLPGDEVAVMSGPFKGLQAVVTRVMPAKQRVAVLLEMLGTQREIEVPIERIVPGKVHPLSARAGCGAKAV